MSGEGNPIDAIRVMAKTDRDIIESLRLVTIQLQDLQRRVLELEKSQARKRRWFCSERPQ